jgi:hypothetical protein
MRDQFVADYRKFVGMLPDIEGEEFDDYSEEDVTMSGRVHETDVALHLGSTSFPQFPVNVKVRVPPSPAGLVVAFYLSMQQRDAWCVPTCLPVLFISPDTDRAAAVAVRCCERLVLHATVHGLVCPANHAAVTRCEAPRAGGEEARG